MLRNSLEISFAKLEHNLDIISERVAPCRVMAILKSDAYGLGAISIAKKLYELGVNHFGISSLQEALELHFLEKANIYLLGSFLASELPFLIDSNIILPLNSFAQAERISKLAVEKDQLTRVQLLIDTGMGRLGIPYEEVESEIKKIIKLPHLDIIGIYSHFSHAYGDVAFTLEQINKLKKVIDSFHYIKFKNIHIANSDAINNHYEEKSYQHPFNMVRVGINLHGCFDLRRVKHDVMNLKQIFTLKSSLIEIKTLPKGSSVGYGRHYILSKRTLIGTVSIGYADGIPLALSYQQSYFKIKDHLVPIIGRVSMDYTTVDLTEVEDAQIGDEVICLDEELTIHTWAQIKKTITYDIICAFGSRVKRVYY